MAWRARRFSIALPFLAALIAFGQNQPTFRTDVNLVQLSVIASDKQGQPVADLRQDEFRLFEDGSPQDIRLFLATLDKTTPIAAPRPPDSSLLPLVTATTPPPGS